jgi:hypothetical protein|tara:strand:+ start:1538 stop:1738 length:201 start_codon:yes stop_codon:yes gene_type:complete
MPHKDFIEMATNDVTPSPDNYSNKTLTLELMSLRVEQGDAGQLLDEFHLIVRSSGPATRAARKTAK